MTDSPEQFVCKFTGEVETESGEHVVAIPEAEIEYGTLSAGDIVRISVERIEQTQSDAAQEKESGPSPPVRKGERRTVEIVDKGEQGDGIARVDRGYVLIVPGSDTGETVEVEVTQVNQNYGFGQLVETNSLSQSEEDSNTAKPPS